MRVFRRASELLFRMLLRAYPRELRDAFAEDMARDHRESLAEELARAGWRGALALWGHTLADWASSVTRERLGSGEPALGTASTREGRRERTTMSLMQGFRRSVRQLLRAPGYTVAFALTLGLGIGANAAIFSVINGVLLKPLPHENGDRLVYVRQSARLSGVENILFSVPEILDIEASVPSFEGVAQHSALTFTMLGFDEPTRVRAGIVTGNYFEVVGLHPLLGRTLRAEDDGEDADPVTVLTHEYWTRAFGGDRGIVGRTFSMNGRTVTVVGVLEPAPPYPERTDLYVNMVTSPHHLGAAMNHDRMHRMTEVFARLTPSATIDGARAEIESVAARLHGEFPESYDAAAGFAVSVTGLKEQLARRARPTLVLLLWTAAFVLVIACANVANLTLTRALRRQRELEVRASLGADRRALRKELLGESFVLCLLGAGLGLAIAYAGLDALTAFASRFTVRASEITLDGRVFLLALVLACGAAFLFAWIPRLPGGSRSTAVHGGRATEGAGRKRLQRSLVVAQFSVSFVLLVGAGLLLRTLLALDAMDPGFETENLLTLDIPGGGPSRSAEEQKIFLETVLERVQALPGARAAALGTVVPLRSEPSGFTSNIEFKIDGRPLEPGRARPRADFRPVTRGYFETLGMSLVAGRLFDGADHADAGDVVMINRSMAGRFFPGEDPIGQRVAWENDRLRFFGLGTGWRTIVGVVDDAKDYGLEAEALNTIYHPFQQEPMASSVFVRTTGDAGALAAPVERIIRALDPDQPVENVLTLEEIRSEALAPRRLNAGLVGAFALLALTISAVGVFGVLAFSVSRRTREFGVRSALGAGREDVLRGILGEGLGLAALGLALGVGAAWALSRFMESALYGVEPGDPATYLAVAAALGAVAVAASWLPARRAAGVDPIEALRAE